MKSSILFVSAFALTSLFATVSPALAQGTAFTYQGRLNDGTNPANGQYDLLFAVYDAAFEGSQRGPIVTNTTAVTNGLFSVAPDFGPDVFTGTNLWLEILVRTNGSGEFSTLSPRQPILPSPYAIMASTASTLLGTLSTTQLTGKVTNDQLANSTVTVNPGTGLSGGGTVPLGGSTTLANAGKLAPNATPIDQQTKDALENQVEETIAEKKALAEKSDKTGQPVAPDLAKRLADPNHIYPVSKPQNVVFAKDSAPAGAISAGDLLKLEPGQESLLKDAGPSTLVAMRVITSKGEEDEVKAGAVITIALKDLQEFDNEFNAKPDLALADADQNKDRFKEGGR
jgi:hypothetical protein